MTVDAEQDKLRKRLLKRLAKLSAPSDAFGSLLYGSGSGVKVFGYCVQARERIARTRLQHPAIVVVLSGTKEVWSGDLAQVFTSGVPFVIPAGVELDFVNSPDQQGGRYESICITVDEELRHTLRVNIHRLPDGPSIPSTFSVPLTEDLIEAFGHAASSLMEPSVAVASAVVRQRILEILLLMSETPVARMLSAVGRIEQVEAVISADPSRAWRVEEVAGALDMGASTLRRHLKDGGASFREVLLSARMATAGALLRSSGYSVAEAAQAAGYVSRSHFARRVQSVHGLTPMQIKKQRSAPSSIEGLR